MRAVYSFLFAVVLCAALRAADPDEIVIADFETDGYGQWQATGEAFGPGPARGTLAGQMEVSGFQGQRLVNSFSGGDKTQGTLTSPEFKITRPFLSFLIGGGYHPDETCINLLVGDKVLRTATGANSERLAWATWDVADLKDKAARLVIVDKHTGGWGHINVDQIILGSQQKTRPAVVEELYQETYRPQFHFSPKKNWLNDPNGLVFYQGEYHLFFQHNPFGVAWGNMHWGHAVSPDLVHWEELPLAIAPDELGAAFSGSAVVDWDNTSGLQSGDEKVLVILYTGAGPKFSQCLAYSNDRGRTWTKYAKNPVIPNRAEGNRDPKVIWHAPSKQWVMALYLKDNDFALYGSKNLTDWAPLSDLRVPGSTECPDLFELPIDGDAKRTRWIFLGGDGNYVIGTFDGRAFSTERGSPEGGKLQGDFGANFYATQSWSDIPVDDGRRIQLAWMNDGGPPFPGAPFKNQMSIPCTLSLRTFPDGLRVCRQPVKELEALRAGEHTWQGQALGPGDDLLAGLAGDLFEIRAEIEPASAAEVGFKIRGATVKYTAADKKLSALSRQADLAAVDGRIKLQILVDRSSLEVFGNDGRVSMTSYFQPEPLDKRLAIFATGGAAKIHSLSVYELRSIWPQPAK